METNAQKAYTGFRFPQKYVCENCEWRINMRGFTYLSVMQQPHIYLFVCLHATSCCLKAISRRLHTSRTVSKCLHAVSMLLRAVSMRPRAVSM